MGMLCLLIPRKLHTPKTIYIQVYRITAVKKFEMNIIASIAMS
jgi:hypothetical protein